MDCILMPYGDILGAAPAIMGLAFVVLPMMTALASFRSTFNLYKTSSLKKRYH